VCESCARVGYANHRVCRSGLSVDVVVVTVVIVCGGGNHDDRPASFPDSVCIRVCTTTDGQTTYKLIILTHNIYYILFVYVLIFTFMRVCVYFILAKLHCSRRYRPPPPTTTTIADYKTTRPREKQTQLWRGGAEGRYYGVGISRRAHIIRILHIMSCIKYARVCVCKKRKKMAINPYRTPSNGFRELPRALYTYIIYL